MIAHGDHLVKDGDSELMLCIRRTEARKDGFEAREIRSAIPFGMTPWADPVIPKSEARVERPVPTPVALGPIEALQRQTENFGGTSLCRRSHELFGDSPRTEAVIGQGGVTVFRKQFFGEILAAV